MRNWLAYWNGNLDATLQTWDRRHTLVALVVSGFTAVGAGLASYVTWVPHVVGATVAGLLSGVGLALLILIVLLLFVTPARTWALDQGAIRGLEKKVDDLHQSSDHIEELREMLDHVTAEPERMNTSSARSLLSALLEHLAGQPIFQLRQNWIVASALQHDKRGRASARLDAEMRNRKLDGLTGGPSALGSRLNGSLSRFPPQAHDALVLEWWVDQGDVLKLGPQWAIARVVDSQQTMNAVLNFTILWDTIPDWPEVRECRVADEAASALLTEISVQAADLKHQTVFPGRCRLCSPKAP